MTTSQSVALTTEPGFKLLMMMMMMTTTMATIVTQTARLFESYLFLDVNSSLLSANRSSLSSIKASQSAAFVQPSRNSSTNPNTELHGFSVWLCIYRASSPMMRRRLHFQQFIIIILPDVSSRADPLAPTSGCHVFASGRCRNLVLADGANATKFAAATQHISVTSPIRDGCPGRPLPAYDVGRYS